jgi:hypothetical protein
MIWCYVFPSIGSSGATSRFLHHTWLLTQQPRRYTPTVCRFIWCPPCHLAVEDLLTQLLRCYTPTVRRFIQCWRTPRQNLTVHIFVSVGWTADLPSIHPVLKLQSWRVFVLIQTKHQIDRRCPHSGRWIIRCYCLRCSSSPINPTQLGNGLSVHPSVSS